MANQSICASPTQDWRRPAGWEAPRDGTVESCSYAVHQGRYVQERVVVLASSICYIRGAEGIIVELGEPIG
jgi:hypothetical protein